jgi:hypothetical protein
MAPDLLPLSPLPSTERDSCSNTQEIRLRQTCDGCTAAKVKCDKGRPACQRCIEGDELCRYSPSRRHGKRARRTRKCPQDKEPTSILGEIRLLSPRLSTEGAGCTISPHSVGPFTWDDINPALTTATNTTYPVPPFPSEQNLDSFITGNSSDFLMWTEFQGLDCVPQRDLDTLFNMQMTPIEQEPSIRDVEMSTDTPDHDDTGKSSSETGHSLECETRALAVLRSLQYSPTLSSPQSEDDAAATDSPQPARLNLSELSHTVDSMDTLLAMNKAALRELAHLLECSCAENSHMALLCFTILSKVAFWYNVAVTKTYNSERVELRPMKIQFGVLDFDDDDNATLHRAVLCRELQKAGSAVRAFETRFKESPWGRLTIRTIREELERRIHEVVSRQTKPF